MVSSGAVVITVAYSLSNVVFACCPNTYVDWVSLSLALVSS